MISQHLIDEITVILIIEIKNTIPKIKNIMKKQASKFENIVKK